MKILITGNFNVVHIGHIRLFQFAKNIGSHLTVGIYSEHNKVSNSSIPDMLRYEAVSQVSLVDEVQVIDEDLENFILRLKPDCIIKGKEHEGQFNLEAELVRQYGGKLLFGSGDHVDLNIVIENGYSRLGPISQRFVSAHDINPKRILQSIKKFKNVKVAVVGDVIVDEYIDCIPLGMSQEDPTIVVSPAQDKRYLGGAGIVAAHASSLGADTSFFSVVGDDLTANFACSALTENKINSFLVVDESRPTTLKQRFRVQNKSLLRVSHLSQVNISSDLQEKLFAMMTDVLMTCDVLIFSDFNYGCLPQALVDRIINLAKANNCIIVADSQASSQISDISRFKGVDLITPTEREARLSVRNYSDSLAVIANKLHVDTNAKNILVKLGANGILINSLAADRLQTDQLSALNKFPVDVSGAGDAMLVATGLSLAVGLDIWCAAAVGTVASAIHISNIGNIPLNFAELASQVEASFNLQSPTA